MKGMALLASASLIALAAPALADDIAVDAPIDSVTVYPQGASITRSFEFELPAGTSVLVIDDLPVGLDAGSLRVEGLGSGAATIQSVAVRRAKDDAENPEREALVDQIEAMREDLRSLDNLRAGLEAQREFITNLISEGPDGFADLLGNAGAGIDQWAAAWDMIGDGIYRIEQNLQDLDAESRAIEEQIEDLLDQIAELPTTPAYLEVAIETSAAVVTEGSMQLTYQVGNARWAPAYDVTLHTGDADEEPSVELVRRAEITQNTGEDWTDVAVTLSTSRPAGGTAAPNVGEALVGVFDVSRRQSMPEPAPAAEAAGLLAAEEDMVFDVALNEAEAIADFGDFKADYVIPTPVSIGSGDGARSVRIATDAGEARLFVEAAPRYSEQAFLTAAFTLESEAPLLAGRATLFRDSAYVGTGNIAFANPGEEVELGFGPDDQVQVIWTLADRETGTRGLLTRIDYDEREYLATIVNNHSRAIEITVLDRMPVADDERVEVERLPQTTEPTEEDVDGRRGVLAWTYEYEPGETREIVNAYGVSWPADLGVYGID